MKQEQPSLGLGGAGIDYYYRKSDIVEEEVPGAGTATCEEVSQVFEEVSQFMASSTTARKDISMS